MLYAGIDAHKVLCYGTIVDEKGNMIRQRSFPANPPGFEVFFKDLPRPIKVVVEACSVVDHIYDWLVENGFDVVVADVLKVKAIASAKIKNDKVDSQTLANLLRGDLIPAAYMPSKELRELRSLVRHRVTVLHLEHRVHPALANRRTVSRRICFHSRSPQKDLRTCKAQAILRFGLRGAVTAPSIPFSQSGRKRFPLAFSPTSLAAARLVELFH